MLHHFTIDHLWFVIPISMMCAKVKHLRCKIYLDAFGYFKRHEFIFWMLYWLEVIIIDKLFYAYQKHIM